MDYARRAVPRPTALRSWTTRSKFESLDLLVHLPWLDLSFTAEAVEENLEALVKLEDLSLYHNSIEEHRGSGSCNLTLFRADQAPAGQ